MNPPLIEYCEPKYAVTEYVYEFTNTLSNFPFLILALQMKGIYKYFMLSLFIGSSLFHGIKPTFYIELLDEVPMLFCLDTLIFRVREENITKIFFYTLNIIIIMLYAYFRSYHIFTNYFTFKILYIISITPPSKFCHLSVIFLLFARLVWSIEQNFCYYDNKLYILHSFWHFLSAMSYCLMLKATQK